MTALADSCPALPHTGLPLLSLLVLAGCCLLVGALLLLLTRHRSRAAAGVVGLATLVAGLTLGTPPPSAEAACGPVGSAGHLTITQTSVLTGLAPDVPPLTITGSVRNVSDDSTWIEAVVVRVASVTTAPEAPAGTCSPADFVLLDPLMPVEHTLGPDTATAFSGAQIGFNSTSANQDACKGATVQLHYETTPYERS